MISVCYASTFNSLFAHERFQDLSIICFIFIPDSELRFQLFGLSMYSPGAVTNLQMNINDI